jgi:hypothetical protein
MLCHSNRQESTNLNGCGSRRRQFSWCLREFVDKRVGMARITVNHELGLAKKDLASPINA